MNTSLRAGVIATQRPMSSSTASSVVADSQIVPADQACSFDFVYASGGSSHTSSSSPTRSTAAVATRSAISRSVLNGRCGPCCSIAPSGWTRMLPSATGRADVGCAEFVESAGGGCHIGTLRRRPSTRRESATDALSAMIGHEPDADGRRLRRDRDRRRPQRSRHGGVPRPRRACARCVLEARADVGGTAGQRAVRRRHGQHLQLRPPHVPHHAGDRGTRPRRPRAALPRRRAGAAQHDVGDADTVHAWSHHHDVDATVESLAAGAARPGRRLPPVRQGGDARRSG